MSPTASACITGCSGRWVWISTRPGRSSRPARPGHLVEQLERALGGAQVAAAEAEIGVDHAHQREVGEVVALGDDLGAEQDVDGVGLHRPDDRGRGLGVARGVAGHHREPRLRQQVVQLLGQALDARARGGEQADGTAARAVLGRRHGVAAMVALQAPAQPVRDQPGRAVRAGEPVAAGAAQGERRVAAAVEEQQRLRAVREIAEQRLAQRRRQEAAARRPLTAQVDQPDLGHGGTAMARRERHMPPARLRRWPAADAAGRHRRSPATAWPRPGPPAQPSSRARASAMSRA